MRHTLQQRDADLMNAIRSVVTNWDDDSLPTLRAAIRRAITSPAPTFYVDFETAYRTITRLHETGGLPRCTNTHKQQMWIDLASLVFDHLNANHGCTQFNALAHVLETQPAPSFYLSETAASTIYYRIKRQQQSKQIKNHK